ncbi:MAG TPA: thioredoxin family protein [Candidatus Aquilonibacter sp.]|nr:thioredoxin family protein [Candidatus Aquilonibacter sp.]
MRFWRAFALTMVPFAAMGFVASAGQNSAARGQASFAPLNEWKAAIISGDRAAIARFYSVNPPTQTKTPTGTSEDASIEPVFWSAIASHGIGNVNAKVLEIERPNPMEVSLVLRIEFTLENRGVREPFVVDAAQVWVKEGSEWKIAMTNRSDLAARVTERLPEPATPDVDLYPPPAEASAEIQSALAAAKRDHKRVLLVFGGNWCYDCHVLNAAFHSPKIAPLVNANYHVVHINIGNMDTNLDIAQKYQVPINKGVPALAVLDANGSLVYSQEHGEFESSVKIGPADVVAFLEKWKPGAK